MDPSVSAPDALLLAVVVGTATTVVRLSFWTAIALPLLYVPLLAGGIDSAADALTLAFLFAANVALLAIGSRHDP